MADVEGEPIGSRAGPAAVPGGAEPGLSALASVRDHRQAWSEDRRVRFVVQLVQGQDRGLPRTEAVGNRGNLLPVAEDQQVSALTRGDVVPEAVVLARVRGGDDQLASGGAVRCRARAWDAGLRPVRK